MRTSRFQFLEPLIFALLAVALVAAQISKPAEVPKVSEFAPSKDLLQQVDFFIARMQESLADPADFDLAKQSRTFKDANTLAALALMLSVHDENDPLKAAMPGLLRAAQALAAADDNYERAKRAFDDSQTARSGT